MGSSRKVGVLGISARPFNIDDGTLPRVASPVPGAVCADKVWRANLDAQTRKLAAIAYGEASATNDVNELGGIAFAVANRARAWTHKSIDQLLTADPNYTYVIKDCNPRFGKLMKASELEIETDSGMKLAVEKARLALAKCGFDPTGGGFWWDGVDFKTNYARHPKVQDGFRFGDKAHNIFGVEESSKPTVTHWIGKDNHGKEIEGKVRGQYSAVWVSTAAWGKTIFWAHDPDFLKATGCKVYR